MIRTYEKLVLIVAIIAMTIADLFFIGGGFFLCAYKGWSLWTIFWTILIAVNISVGIFRIVGITVNE